MISVVLAMLVALGVTVAIAAYTPGEQDLTYLDATAELNDGGVIQQSFAGNVGTGNLLSFLRVQNSPSEQGYNTSDRRSGGTKIFYGPSSSAVGTDDKTDGNFTRDLPLNVVPLVSYTPPGGTAGLYREFRLDLNENSGSGALVSLTRADVWIGTATEINYFETGLGDFESFSSGSSVAGSADLVWSMANNTWVILNADLSSGSGKNGDARLLVPESAFEIAGATDCPYNPDATDCGTYVYFDTEFGEVPETTGSTSVGSAGIESISDSTFEEWSTRKVPYVTKTATTSVTRTYDWTITKSVTPDAHQLFDGDSDTSDYTITVTKGAPVDSGFTVEGVITINNPSGSDTIRVTDITDTIDGYGEATVDCGTLTVPFEIDGGDSVECSYTATAPGSTNPFGDENTVVVDYGYVDKQGGLSLEDTTAAKADIDFSSPSVTTVNGSVTVTDTFESDAAHGLGTISSSTTFTQSDDSYLRRTFDCSDVIFGSGATTSDTVEYDNTARITSTDGLDKSDDASVDVTCYKPTITKDAGTSLTRTYDWTITKSVTPGAHYLFDGDSDTSDYTITVTKLDPTDSAFGIDGSIYVTNTHPTDSMTVSLSDTLDDATPVTIGSCTGTGVSGTYDNLTITAGSMATCSYSASPTTKDATKNTASFTLFGKSYSGDADVDFSTASVTPKNDSVTVTDTFESDAAHGLGTISSSTTFTQSDDSYLRRTFDCSDVTFAAEATASDTVEYDNTARITSTDGLDKSDDASVDVTCYKPTITKDANTSFTRTYNWTIDKDALDADGNPIGSEGLMLNQGQSYNLHWTITVELDGTTPYTDSAFGIDGSIYVTNTHLTDSMTVSLSDTLTGSDAVAVSIGACTGDGVSGTYDALTITAGSMATCSYSASPTGKDVTKNTASFTLFGKSYSGDADVDFSDGAADITKVNATVKVTDTFPYPGGTETDLGTVSVTDPLPKTFDFYTLLSTDANDNPDFLLVCEENLITNRADVYNYDDSILGARLGYDTRDVPVYVTCEVGCTLTQGYWKTHSSYGPAPDDENWLLVLPDGPDTTFFYSGQSWYEVFWTPPKGGNAYYQLAHQWMAATLNVLAGASTTTEVDAALADAEAWFDNPAHTPEYAGSLHGKNGKEERAQLIEWAGILGDYNTGLIGPGHCDEDGYTKLDTAAAASAGFLVLFGAFELIRKRREEL